MKWNYKQALEFRLHLMNGSDDTGFPDYDWTLLLYTFSRGKPLKVSCCGGVMTNCYNDDGAIRVVCGEHRFWPGELMADFTAEFSDGRRRSVTQKRLQLEFWDKPSTYTGVPDLYLDIYGSMTPDPGDDDWKPNYTDWGDIKNAPVAGPETLGIITENRIGEIAQGKIDKLQLKTINGNSLKGEGNITIEKQDLTKVVTELPSTEIDDKLIYILAKDDEYEKYVHINGKWEMLGGNEPIEVESEEAMKALIDAGKAKDGHFYFIAEGEEG